MGDRISSNLPISGSSSSLLQESSSSTSPLDQSISSTSALEQSLEEAESMIDDCIAKFVRVRVRDRT